MTRYFPVGRPPPSEDNLKIIVYTVASLYSQQFDQCIWLKQKNFWRLIKEQFLNVNKYESTLRDLLLVDIQTVHKQNLLFCWTALFLARSKIFFWSWSRKWIYGGRSFKMSRSKLLFAWWGYSKLPNSISCISVINNKISWMDVLKPFKFYS